MNTEIVQELRGIKSLEKAIRYLETKAFPLNLMEVIAQDEFNHDVVVPFPGEQAYLALAVT